MKLLKNKWVRNLVIGMVLNSIKNSKVGKIVLSKLKEKNTLVGRVGIIIFTGLGAAKYYYPDLPLDDGIEILGLVFSWLALELGFEKIKNEELLKFDPNNPIDIDLGDFTVSLPQLPEFNRKITPDETGEFEPVSTDSDNVEKEE